ncbi:hypothetical protein MSG28_007435 [Choristoneura fumiferana]|uniref:Uncharacterized protein n=1 Tax=Choristoneura fumiferana TaxID=7141 RepID=A0ACC0JXU0_CHOFU|nr:hypothetical protein MSG28_007435 [Choristoneura fumiferana]
MSGFVKIAIDDYYSDSNWTTIIEKYWMMAEKVSDPRVQGWFLFDTPLPTLAMVIAYLAFVMVIGPLWMENKKPFQIKNTLVAYNAFQVLLSSYMFYEHLMSGWWGDYSLACQPVDYSESEQARRMLHLCWVYYFSKLSEFADTVFFVLRKKKSQITWLHLYHHSLTPFEAWMLVKFIAGGHGTFSNIVNNLVHIIMIIAFGLILHSTIFIVLFTNFYVQAYKKDKRIAQKPKIEPTNNNNVSNDSAKATGQIVNGQVSNGQIANGQANGHVRNGLINGHATDVREKTKVQ